MGPSPWPTWIGGAIIYIVLRALGEMSVRNPVAGSFGEFASNQPDRRILNRTGWTYVFEMIVVCTGRRHRLRRLHGLLVPPDVPGGSGIGTVFFIGAINLLSVKVFGELEFWFTLVKIVAIVAFVDRRWHRDSHLRVQHSRHLHRRLESVVPRRFLQWNRRILRLLRDRHVRLNAAARIIGITAGEAKNPEDTLPGKWSTLCPIRILLFC